MSKSNKAIFWIDLEMTGLDENIHKILEVAVVITDFDLLAKEEFHRVVFQPPEELTKMDDWCKKTHKESGLVDKIKDGLPVEKIQWELLELVGRHFSSNTRVILAGNSVGNDKRFIDKYMPEFAKRLHYRLIDVSSFKEVFREKYGIKFEKKNGHRALDDIYESINELKHYLDFVKVPESQD